MDTHTIEVDPLSNYEYHGYRHYAPIPIYHPTPPAPQPQYSFDVKMEPNLYPPNQNCGPYPPPYNYAPQHDTNLQQVTNENVQPNNEQAKNTTTVTDQAPETTDSIFNLNNVKKERNGKTFKSNMSAKIQDADYPFYCCAVCNITYRTLLELDQHVVVHSDRITSYDLRIKRQLQKKQKKQEQKKLKRMKKENLVIEIKPEDGYIGNETAAEFNLNTESGTFAMEETNKESVTTETNKDSNETNDMPKSDAQKIVEPDKQTDDQKPIDNTLLPNTRFAKKYKDLYSGMDRQCLMNLEKIYKCYACNKQFTLSYYLKLHVRSHTDEKPYTCAVCGESFITASKLGRHNKRIHLNIRHQCRICYRFFSRFEVLTKHFDKKHADDKIEGEPYDYNAIVPYLKELEEELREKKESEKKMKTEDPWLDAWAAVGMDPNHMGLMTEPKEENLGEESEAKASFDIPIEEVKIDVTEVAVMVIKEEKQEPEDDAYERVKSEEDVKDHADEDEGVAKEDNSDEDYFPSSTWTSAPKVEIASPPSPPKKKRKEGRLICDICNKKLSSITYMKVHMRTHTGEKPYKCHVCSRGFITSSKMHRHVLSRHNDDESTKATEDGDKSENDSKSNNKELQNAKAKFKKKKKKLPKLDRKTHKREHVCEFCHKRFMHKETLEVHKVSHKGETLVLKCNFCLIEFEEDEALRSHEATHGGPKPYLCTICGKGYKKRETMVYHKKQHAPDKDFACVLCNRMFNAQSKLQRHMVTHRSNKFTYRYECPVCAHMFHTKYHIQMHLNTHQKEGLIIEENRNDILAMVLQNARKIPKQSAVVTTLPSNDELPADERSRVCNICGEVFQHFYFLEEHLKSHGSKLALEDTEKAEERKYVCEVCNKGFKLHYYLKLHSFTHNKVRPFICQQCGKGFITKGKLKRHLETHAGLKKYQCHICYKFFTRPSYLRIHVRTIHGTQDYNFRVEKEYGSYSANSISTMSEYSI